MSVCFLAHIHLRTPELIHKCRKKKNKPQKTKPAEPWDNIPVEFSK